jgi:hypothetical protein
MRLSGEFYDLSGIAGEITDGGGDLPESNLHLFSVTRLPCFVS